MRCTRLLYLRHKKKFISIRQSKYWHNLTDIDMKKLLEGQRLGLSGGSHTCLLPKEFVSTVEPVILEVFLKLCNCFLTKLQLVTWDATWDENCVRRWCFQGLFVGWKRSMSVNLGVLWPYKEVDLLCL